MKMANIFIIGIEPHRYLHHDVQTVFVQHIELLFFLLFFYIVKVHLIPWRDDFETWLVDVLLVQSCGKLSEDYPPFSGLNRDKSGTGEYQNDHSDYCQYDPETG